MSVLSECSEGRSNFNSMKMTIKNKPLKVHLLGSSPYASESEFFKAVTHAVPNQISSLPDGETGARDTFILYQRATLPSHVIQPRWGGQPTRGDGLGGDSKPLSLEDVKPTGYDDHAIKSYNIFRSLKESGIIPSNVRFQVCLPTPVNVARVFVEQDKDCVQIEELYEIRLLEALKRIQEAIPASELTIQWDLPTECVIIEYERGRSQDRYFKPYFEGRPVQKEIVKRLARLTTHVKPDVELGIHLCYGDLGHRHFVEPEDTGVMVDFANEIISAIQPTHQIKYFHMPVPKDRDDEAYFLPLQRLKLPEDTDLFLGVVHADDEEGTRRRLKTARDVYPNVAGIGSECGLGRTPMAEIDEILRIHSCVAADG